MKRIFIYLAVILASVTVIAVADSRNKVDSFIEANIDALTQSENTGFDCVLEKDNCRFTISTQAQLEILKRKYDIAALGVTLDLSSGTQIYREKKSYEAGVRCGNDITCNDFLRQLGLID